MKPGQLVSRVCSAAWRCLGPASVGLLFYAAAVFGLTAHRAMGGLAGLWLANGLLLAACLRTEPARVKLYLAFGALASLLANWVGGADIARDIQLAVANISGVAVAVFLVRRLCPRGLSLYRPDDVGKFCLAVIGQASVGALIAAADARFDFARDLAMFASWFMTDLLGTLVVTPMVLIGLAAKDRDRTVDDARNTAERVALLSALLIVATSVFSQSTFPGLFLPLAVLQLVTLRLGVFGAATGVLIIALVGSVATAAGSGPICLIKAGANAKMLYFQFYLVVVFASALPLAASRAATRRLTRRIERSERRHRLLIERSPAVIFEIDAAGRWTFLSCAWSKLAGHSPEAALGTDYTDVIHPDDRADTRAVVESLRAGDADDRRRELRYRAADGSYRWATFRCYANKDAGGAVIGTGGSLSDITERVATAQALVLSERRYRLLAENATDIIFRLGREGRILYVSPAVEAVTGFAPAALTGRDPVSVMHADDRDRVQLALARLWLGHAGQAVVAYRTRCADGSWRWLEANARLAMHDGVEEIVGVARDISERQRFEADLLSAREAAEAAAHEARHLAETDELTGLASRRMFMRQLDRAKDAARSQSRPLAVAVFDIDHFKRVNDRYGHATGDDVLARVAAMARLAVRRGDLVGRLGGEEFGILMPDADLGVAATLCEHVRQSIAADADPASQRPCVTVSIGVAAHAAEGTTSALLAAADTALYEAKRTGRNRLCRAA